MALLNIDASAIGNTFANTAAGKAAQSVAQSMSPGLVQDVQRVLKVGNAIGQYTGFSTGIGLIDNVFGLSGADGGTPLLGGLALRQAEAIHRRVRSARVALKNLFFVRLTEQRAPSMSYGGNTQGGSTPGLGGLAGSVIGKAASSVGSAVGAVAGNAIGSMASNFVGAAGTNLANKIGIPGAGSAGSPNIGAVAASSFDMLAMDVSYGAQLLSDHVQVGSSFIDRPTGRNPAELTITTMDDEAGTLKQWFQAKLDQVAHPDGTFGLPADYLVNIEIVHAIPSPEVETAHLAYSHTLRLRASSMQVDLSRREQAVAELPMVFNQFDGFMGIK